MIWFLHRDPLECAEQHALTSKQDELKRVIRVYISYLLKVANKVKSNNPYIQWLGKRNKNFEYLMFLTWYLIGNLKNEEQKAFYVEIMETWIYGPQFLPQLPLKAKQNKPPSIMGGTIDKGNPYKSYRALYKRITH